jgi:hypothetical protein
MHQQWPSPASYVLSLALGKKKLKHSIDAKIWGLLTLSFVFV